MREIVTGWARAGAPNVSALIEREDGDIWWPTRTVQSTVHSAEGQRPIAFAKTAALIPTLAWLLGDVMIKKLDLMLAEEADDGAALSGVDRQRQAAHVGGDLLSTERDPAFFVWAGLPQGLPVWFGDVNPAAILGRRTRDATGGRRRRNKRWACDRVRRAAAMNTNSTTGQAPIR
jgi:hypothetical protein